LSLATETDGSIVQSTTRAALYSLKLTYGTGDLTGIYYGAKSFGHLVTMARSTEELSRVLSIFSKENLTGSLPVPWEGV